MKPLTFNDIAKALEEISKDTVLSTAVPQAKIDFLREVLPDKKKEHSVVTVDDVIVMSKTLNEFYQNLFVNFSVDNVTLIEELTRGQNDNLLWYECRKGVISASKGHEIKTKMDKVIAGRGGYIKMFGIYQKISGYSYVSPDIPALKYGREMKNIAANHFLETFKRSHKMVCLTECGLFLEKKNPFIGASPDRIVSCKCHAHACLEIKCPYSISHLSPKDPSVKLDYIEHSVNGTITLKRSHKYYTQCQQQMGVTGLKSAIFLYGLHTDM